MADTLVRRDIWNLEDEGPWHPFTRAYALAIDVMKGRPASDPTSWDFQAAIHEGRGQTGNWREQCQHFCWYFLPWHRMYLHWFEAIVRDAIGTLDDVDQDVKDSWALPYWNYSRGGNTASLPQAFLEEELDGNANPLFVEERDPGIKNGDPLNDNDVRLGALFEPDFTNPAQGGFG